VCCGTEEDSHYVKDKRLNIKAIMCDKCAEIIPEIHKMLEKLYLITFRYVNDINININVLSVKYKIYNVNYNHFYVYNNGKIGISVFGCFYNYTKYVNKFLSDLENIDDDDFDENDYYAKINDSDNKIYKNECRNIYKSYYMTLPNIGGMVEYFMDIYNIIRNNYILEY